MVSARFAAVALLLTTTRTLARSEWEERRILKRSNTVTDPTVLVGTTFDYVIVGGGTAGLVIANRLSQNPSTKVAVIEAGLDGSAVETKIDAPAYAYFGGIASLTSDYDWHYETVNQTYLNDRSIFWPRGKVLGGSSAVNGLYMCRGSQIEQDSWASLYPGSEDVWGWNATYPYMKKSETWTAPSKANQKLANMTLTPSYHGTSGPIHYSYPGFFYPQVANWVPTLESLGVTQRDPAGGETWGAYITTSAINPTGWSRSYSKTGYLDPAANRTNLVVLTGYQATKITFSGTTANGVSFAASANGTVYTIAAAKEVILSAGVIGSPQLLQVSGVGPQALLDQLGIPVVVDLPGVGLQLADHLSGALYFNTTSEITGDMVETNATYAAEQLQLWEEGDASSLYNSPNDAIAYVDLVTLFGEDDASDFISDLKANQTSQIAVFASKYSNDSTVVAGYNASYSAELNDVFPSAVGQAEILMSNTGAYGSWPGAKTVAIQFALQHPLSRGSVMINSKSTFDAPLVDPAYLQHPGDIQILRQAAKFARTIANTEPISSIIINELSPGASVSTDEEWEAWIRSVVSTEYHPSGSCSMLPLEKGGVVDTEMRVYGTSNLRIVDSSIVPISLSAHMTSPLYGYAETAAAIILQSSNVTSNVQTTSHSSTAGTATAAQTSQTTSTTTSNAFSLAPRVMATLASLSFTLALLA